MDAHLESIRAALGDGATDEQRRAGLDACRMLIRSMEAETADRAPVAAPSTPDGNPFAGLTADQVIELAINRLRATVGSVPAAADPGFRLTLVPVPRLP